MKFKVLKTSARANSMGEMPQDCAATLNTEVKHLWVVRCDVGFLIAGSSERGESEGGATPPPAPSSPLRQLKPNPPLPLHGACLPPPTSLAFIIYHIASPLHPPDLIMTSATGAARTSPKPCL